MLLLNSDKLKAFIAPNMPDIITLLENDGKYDVYKGGKIHGIYWYIEMTEYSTTLTTLDQRSNHFGL